MSMRYALWISVICLFGASSTQAQWFQKVDTLSINLDSSYCYGASWIDYDGDNDLDLYNSMAGFSGPHNELHINNGDGTFSPLIGLNIVGHGGKSLGNGWADINNDGEVDLFVNNTSPDSNFLYTNNGAGGSFTRITTGNIGSDIAPNEGNSSWGDYDNDGFVDLYVVTWNNSANLFYRNNGNGTFTKITTGAIATDASWSSCAIWGDYDKDGDLDLYVANYVDQTGTNPATNRLYQNNGNGTFTSVSTGSPVTDAARSRSANWVDYDNDGDLDLFVANESQDHLYTNNGNGTFTAVTTGLIVTENIRADASNWGDFDNDGDQDLLKVGQISGHHRMFENLGNGSFSSINPDNITNFGIWMVGVGFVDYNQDGWLDVHAMNYGDNQKDYIYQNLGPNCRSFAQFRLQGDTSNWSAIGTKVYVKATLNGNPVWQFQQVSAQTAKGVQNPQFLHFGLDNATIIDSVIVEWPAGGSCTFTNVDVRKFYRIEETCLISTILDMGFNPFAGDTTLCGGDSLLLDASYPGVNSWLWNDGSTDSIKWVTNAGKYWVSADTSSNCSGTDTIDVGVFWPETVGLGPDTNVCSGSSLVLSAAGTGTGPWLWSDGSNDSTLTVNAAGTYWVAAGPSACEKRDTIVVGMSTTIPANLGSDTSICDGDTIMLSVPSSYTVVMWNDSSVASNYKVLTPGIYWVDVLDSNGCASRDSIEISTCVSITTTEAEEVLAFPNPVSELLSIRSSQRCNVSLRDFNGRLVARASGENLSLDCKGLPAGIYFLQINRGKAFSSRRIVVQH